ncbi:MAG: PqqD family protein [Kiritimatiellia bacterium]
MSIGPDSVVSRSGHAVYRVVDSEAVIVEPSKALVNVANPAGSRVWELADGSRTAAEIAAVIAGEYEVENEQALKDTLEFLDDLGNKHLVTFEAPDENART